MNIKKKNKNSLTHTQRYTHVSLYVNIPKSNPNLFRLLNDLIELVLFSSPTRISVPPFYPSKSHRDLPPSASQRSVRPPTSSSLTSFSTRDARTRPDRAFIRSNPVVTNCVSPSGPLSREPRRAVIVPDFCLQLRFRRFSLHHSKGLPIRKIL